MSCLGCNAIEGPAHILADGTKVCTSCPDWRLQCFAQEMIDKWPMSKIAEHLAKVEKGRHGIEEAAEMRRVLRLLWDKKGKQ